MLHGERCNTTYLIGVGNVRFNNVRREDNDCTFFPRFTMLRERFKHKRKKKKKISGRKVFLMALCDNYIRKNIVDDQRRLSSRSVDICFHGFFFFSLLFLIEPTLIHAIKKVWENSIKNNNVSYRSVDTLIIMLQSMERDMTWNFVAGEYFSCYENSFYIVTNVFKERDIARLANTQTQTQTHKSFDCKIFITLEKKKIINSDSQIRYDDNIISWKDQIEMNVFLIFIYLWYRSSR